MRGHAEVSLSPRYRRARATSTSTMLEYDGICPKIILIAVLDGNPQTIAGFDRQICG
jgi:hypothetical protein